MAYTLDDGTSSTDYKVGDKFKVMVNGDAVPFGTTITLIRDDKSSMPFFLESDSDNQDEIIMPWECLEKYQENVGKKNDQSMGMDFRISDRTNSMWGLQDYKSYYKIPDDDIKAVQVAVHQVIQGCSSYTCKDLDKLLNGLERDVLFKLFRALYAEERNQ